VARGSAVAERVVMRQQRRDESGADNGGLCAAGLAPGTGDPMVMDMEQQRALGRGAQGHGNSGAVSLEIVRPTPQSTQAAVLLQARPSLAPTCNAALPALALGSPSSPQR
jgi:hypothetical protein